MARTVGTVHGITQRLMGNGYFVHTSPTGRKVAVSDRTYRLLKARRAPSNVEAA